MVKQRPALRAQLTGLLSAEFPDVSPQTIHAAISEAFDRLERATQHGQTRGNGIGQRQVEMLRQLEVEHGGSINWRVYLSSHDIELLRSLQRRGLAEHTYAPGSDIRWRITDAGRAELERRGVA